MYHKETLIYLVFSLVYAASLNVVAGSEIRMIKTEFYLAVCFQVGIETCVGSDAGETKTNQC